MPRRSALILLLGMLAGCTAPEPVPTSSWAKRMRAPFESGDMVQLVLAVLERDVGDSFINHELWEYTDEQVVDLERKACLDDNGFRVGQVVGMPPGRLQELLSSKRSCANPRLQLLPAGRAAPQVLGPILERAEFHVKENGQDTAINLDQVQFIVDIVPALAGETNMRLRFTPRAEFGEPLPEMKSDGSNWSFHVAKPQKTFPALSWEVTLPSSTFLVVGANINLPSSLAYQLFVKDDGPEPRQRLLVIRASRPNQASDSATASMDAADPSPPLVQRATATAFRASRQ